MDKSRLTEDDRIIYEAYDYKCANCGWNFAVAIHEEPPRSLNPQWRDQPWTRFPVCAYCHHQLQDMPRDEAALNLEMSGYLWFPGVVERIRANATNECTTTE